MKVIFVGKPGEFIAGVPARDMSGEEFKRLAPASQDLAIKSGLYRIDKEKPAPKAEE